MRLGSHYSPEVLAKIIEARRKQQRSRESVLASVRAATAAWKGKHHSPESKLKMSEATKGKKRSDETRHKISEAARHRTIATRYNMSEAQKGKHLSPEHKLKLSEIFRGRNTTLETRRKMSEAQKGPKHWNWKGGVLPRNRSSVEYNEWRRRVFKRDYHTCQRCDVHGGHLRAHHIVGWVVDPSKRYEVANGITLCILCHRKEHRGKRQKVA
jgi:hypothetical protein